MSFSNSFKPMYQTDFNPSSKYVIIKMINEILTFPPVLLTQRTVYTVYCTV